MNIAELTKELNFKAIRSSGAGGQHVNKVSSKIELSFDIKNSNILSSKEKELLHKKLANKLTKNHFLILFCDETRSQHRNKELVIKRFIDLIKINLIRPKKRILTKPSKSSIKKSIENKKRKSIKKLLRKKPKI
ncbi:alternative ribosome rescue aminoacyl-tRNA hydrolase ArfB [Tenacibaculum sp. nBUS_03]|uniref:alternative ribosome rescue aminoacyl-tRNA hydrolase ArfB n=1 Tax=Tenacibaculum sp. nBUS_03 TaxID=3395320 RepID=UPI003EBDD160